jgi:hypothetical protein
MSADVYECTRCGAAFGIAGEAGPDDDGTLDAEHHELVQWHEDKQCTPLVRTPLERARLLVDLQWNNDEDELPTDAAAAALLALAEEQRTANLIAVLALPSAVKSKAVTDAKNRMLVDVVERLGLGGAS